MRRAHRQRRHGAALAAGYENAGTVEFLLDQAGGFYFIEMNTRLQVEHPVTEVITGLDLVEWQLRIAAGEPLPLRQEEIAATATLSRRGSTPRTRPRGSCRRSGGCGTLRLPEGLAGVRVDTGVEQGDAVTPYYDPMIAKIIAHGADRAPRWSGWPRPWMRPRSKASRPISPSCARRRGSAPFRAMRIDTGWLDREGTEALAAELPRIRRRCCSRPWRRWR